MASSLNYRPLDRRRFRRALLQWFDVHQRELPWRQNRDPYRVWVSEIMLQQTRVTAVLEHYRRFLARFPTVTTLARAHSATVLGAWSGLGYYRRVRMMHAAARKIVRELRGCFPQDETGWRALPGVGRYTAAAIASICYGRRCAVVDGNVKRVLERVSGISSQEVWTLAGELLSPSRPGDFNQAMMELGATLCTPKTPNCLECPVCRWCQTGAGGLSLTPRRKAARTRRELAYALVTDGNCVLLRQRGAQQSVMPGMWELPEIQAEALNPGNSGGVRDARTFTVRHAIMHTDYLVQVVHRELGSDGVWSPLGGQLNANRDAKWFAMARALRLPLTGLARKILQRQRVI